VEEAAVDIEEAVEVIEEAEVDRHLEEDHPLDHMADDHRDRDRHAGDLTPDLDRDRHVPNEHVTRDREAPLSDRGDQDRVPDHHDDDGREMLIMDYFRLNDREMGFVH